MYKRHVPFGEHPYIPGADNDVTFPQILEALVAPVASVSPPSRCPTEGAVLFLTRMTAVPV